MPTMPLDVTRRVKRFSEQRWLLDTIISLMGPDWDQGRLGYMAGACGHDSQGDFVGLRQLIKTFNDMTRELMKAARRRERRAEAELKLGHVCEVSRLSPCTPRWMQPAWFTSNRGETSVSIPTALRRPRRS